MMSSGTVPGTEWVPNSHNTTWKVRCTELYTKSAILITFQNTDSISVGGVYHDHKKHSEQAIFSFSALFTISAPPICSSTTEVEAILSIKNKVAAAGLKSVYSDTQCNFRGLIGIHF